MGGIGDILHAHREEIISSWVSRLHREVSDRYRTVPVSELLDTITEGVDANFAVLTEDDYSPMDTLIDKIARLRLKGGFSLSEVQAAFESYRTVVLPILVTETDPPRLLDTLLKLNRCLEYSIRRFSDHFQALHEGLIISHARELECKVEDRTREVAESEAKYRVLVEEINDGYFVHQRGILVFANQAFADMHGYSQKEVIGRPFNDFVAPESREDLWKLYRERLATGDSRNQYVYLRLLKDGSQLYTENKVKLITYQGKTATAGICRDVTERMELEKQQLRLADLESERKSIALETLHQLMVTLSHYLLNANAIIGGMVRRSERTSSAHKRLASLKAIKEQTMKTEAVIEALKKVAEIKTADYGSESHVLMIDVRKEIEDHLAAVGAEEPPGQEQES